MFEDTIERNKIIADFLKKAREFLEELERKKQGISIHKTQTSDLLNLLKSNTNGKVESNIDIFTKANKVNSFDKIIDKLNNSIGMDSSFIDKRKFLNSNVGDLIKSGPNLLSNMYDVYFTIYQPSHIETEHAFLLLSTRFLESGENSISETEKEINYSSGGTKVLESLTEDIYSLSVRTASISIPQRSISTSQIPFESTTVTIPTTEWDTANEASLDITLDANLYIYDIFNSLSGLIRRGYIVGGESSGFKKEDNKVKIMTPNGLRPSDTKINLTVAAHNLTGISNYSFNDYPVSTNNILFEFEDIKFLGVPTAVNFNNTSSSGKSVGVPFIFKNLRTIYATDSNKDRNSKESGIEYNKSYNDFFEYIK